MTFSNTKEKKNNIRVMTASEFKDRIRSGNPPSFEEIDAVTCGTFGVMSGTAAVFSFRASDAGLFNRANEVTLNGVPAIIGPCPNERNGFIDVIIFGTSVSKNSGKYGGGHLFKDIVSEKIIAAEIQTDSGSFHKNLTIHDLNTARLIVTRGAFKNYSAFVNTQDQAVSTIFSVLPLREDISEASVSGCGEINPLQNDPLLKHHSPGTSILVNGAKGILLGAGTRSTAEKPNLSAAADMFDMDPDLMGGFVTSEGVECLTSVASVIPVTDEETFQSLCVTDQDISLPVIDVGSRSIVSSGSYADVWSGTDRLIQIREEKCQNCAACSAVSACPVNAFISPLLISKACVSCLTCTVSCPNGVYEADGGTLPVAGKRVSIRLRQSDRNRGERAAELLKKEIEEGRWVI